jgi:hypothetical protein
MKSSNREWNDQADNMSLTALSLTSRRDSPSQDDTAFADEPSYCNEDSHEAKKMEDENLNPSESCLCHIRH